MNLGSLFGCGLSNQLIQAFTPSFPSSSSSFPFPYSSFPSSSPFPTPANPSIGEEDTSLDRGRGSEEEDSRSGHGVHDGERDEDRRIAEEGKVYTDSIGEFNELKLYICF